MKVNTYNAHYWSAGKTAIFFVTSFDNKLYIALQVKIKNFFSEAKQYCEVWFAAINLRRSSRCLCKMKICVKSHQPAAN